MKNTIQACFSMLFLSCFLQAESSDINTQNTSYNERKCNPISIDTKVGAFFLLSSDVANIYGPVLPAFTLEGTANVYKGLNIWLEGSYLFGNGHAIHYGHNSTHLNFVPISLGVTYSYPITKSVDFYVGAGPRYSFLLIKDHSSFVNETVTSNNWGFIAKSGFIYHCTQYVFLEGFVNYSYQKFHFPKTSKSPFVYRNDVNLSGIGVGASFGYTF